MTDQQLYLAIGIPSFVVLTGMLMNGALFLALNGRMSSLESRMLGLDGRMETLAHEVAGLTARVAVLEDRLARV